MKSKISGRSYVILFHDDDKYPIKVNRKKIDKALTEISAAMENIQAVLQSVHTEKDMDLYRLLGNAVFDSFSFDCSNGVICELLNALEKIKEFQFILASHDDDIHLSEDPGTLRDLGYRYVYPRYGKEKIWEKVIVDTDEQTETEEIIPAPDNPIRRRQTILWEKHDLRPKIYIRKIPETAYQQKTEDGDTEYDHRKEMKNSEIIVKKNYQQADYPIARRVVCILVKT